MRLFLVFLILNALFISTVRGQTSESLKIDEIRFEGLKKTNFEYLSQFLDIELDGDTSQDDISRNEQNIKNVAGISNAVAYVDTIDGKVRLNYDIEEVKTLLPVINLGGIQGNLWFGLGFSDYNWRGRGQLLSAVYQNNNGLHSGEVYYKVPRINQSLWGYSAGLSSWNSEEPLFFDEGTVNYTYTNNSLNTSLIRNFGNQTFAEIGGTFFQEKYKKSDNQILQDAPGPNGLTQLKFLSKFIYSHNKINNDFFYKSGYSLTFSYQNVYTFSDNSLFNSVQLKGVKYIRPKEGVNLAFRLIIAGSTNNDTPFAPFVADSHVNIRGIGNRIDRGTAQVVFNAEYRQTVFNRKNWSGQVVIFSDVGNWREPGGDISQLVSNTFLRQFIGGGFRLIYQKVFGAVFRIDYGVDVFTPFERGVVIGIGQYF